MKKIVLKLALVAIGLTMMCTLTGCTLWVEPNSYDANEIKAAGKELGPALNNIVKTNKNTVNEFIEAKKKVFNAKFEEYKGELIDAAKIKILLTVVIPTANANGKGNIKVEGDVTSAADINSSKTYSVEFGYDDDGLVNEVKITEDK